jgi:hypothetical protein
MFSPVSGDITSGVTFYDMDGTTQGSAITVANPTVVTGQWKYTMPVWCTTTCADNQGNWNFRIIGLKNSATTQPPTVFCDAKTYSNFASGLRLDQALNFIATPKLKAGPLNDVNITRTVNMVGLSTKYTV